MSFLRQFVEYAQTLAPGGPNGQPPGGGPTSNSTGVHELGLALFGAAAETTAPGLPGDVLDAAPAASPRSAATSNGLLAGAVALVEDPESQVPPSETEGGGLDPRWAGAAMDKWGTDSSTADLPLASLTVDPPEGGSGTSWGDDSSITFTLRAELHVGGGLRDYTELPYLSREGTVEMDAGTSGELTLSMKIHGFQDNVFINETFDQEISVAWKVSADKDGALTIDSPQERWGAPSSGTSYRLDSINPDRGNSFVQVSPVIVGGSNSGGISGGPVQIAKQAASAKIKETFRVDIKVKVPPAPKVPEPKGTVEMGDQVTVVGKHDYTIGPFKVGSPNVLETGSLKKVVYDIVQQAVPPEIRDQLINGKLAGGEKIEIHGYASNTDSEDRNFILSKERAKSVLAEFQSLGIPANLFTEPLGHGEWETPEPTDDKRKEKEDAGWRKVVLKIRHEMTFQMDPKTGESLGRIK